MATADFSRISANIGALNALNSLRNVNKNLAMHQERLATGKRINNSGDDPAGLTIANKLNARSEGLKTALNNIADAKNLLSVADSGVGKISNILTNMRNLAQSGVSDTLGADERQALKDQLESYITQIDDIVTETTWNGTQLLDQTGFTFQTGADSGDVTTFSGTSVTLNSSASGLNLNAASLNSTSGTTFQTFMNSVDSAIDTVSAEMSNIGALINRLGFKEEQLAVAQVNVEASYNRIMNADMAMEQLESTKFSILQQTSITMLSQANSAPQGVLQLFR